jgi:hypothetical protein
MVKTEQTKEALNTFMKGFWVPSTNKTINFITVQE